MYDDSIMNENKIITLETTKAKQEKEYRYILGALKNLEDEYKFERLNPYDFECDEPGYSKHEIDQDLELLANKRKKYGDATLENKIAKIKADFLERLIVVGVSQFEWFGKNTESSLVSEFDDEINFIDGAIKFNSSEHATQFRMLGLDFDATFTSDIDSIYTKVHALKSDLDKNNIPKLKYIRDDIFKKNGVLLPKVVLGCDNASLDVLLKEIANKKFDILKDNPIQNKLLIQAEAQLSAFKDRYSRKSNYYKHQREDAEKAKDIDKVTNSSLEERMAARLFDMHSQILRLISKVGEEKGTFSFANEKDFFSDAVHVKIMDATKHINKQKQ